MAEFGRCGRPERSAEGMEERGHLILCRFGRWVRGVCAFYWSRRGGWRQIEGVTFSTPFSLEARVLLFRYLGQNLSFSEIFGLPFRRLIEIEI